MRTMVKTGLKASLIACGAVLAVSAGDAFADTVTWNQPLGGAWETGSNWDSGAPPTSADFAYAPLNVDISSTGPDNQAFELFNSSRLGVTAGQLAVTGTLTNDVQVTLSGGAAILAGRVENDTGGAVTVTDPASALSVTQGIYNYGGIVKAVNGGAISAESIDNQVQFSAAGGGRISANSLVNWAGAQFNVDNTGSRLDIHGAVTNNGAVTVGDAGTLTAHSIDNTGGFTVQSGGQVQSESMINDTGGTVSASGAGTAFAVSGGDTTNRGTITADAGGAFTAGTLDNYGTLGGSGGGTLSAGSITNHAGATLDIHDPGTVLTATGVVQNSSTVNVTGGASATVGGYHQLAGVTSIGGGTLTSANDLVFDGGTLNGSGTLAGNTIWFNQGAALSPGSAPGTAGTVNLTGNLALKGTSVFDIGGLSQFDLVTISGAATLGGALDVNLFNGFLPAIGDSFDILLASSITGSFSSLHLPVFNGLSFDVLVQPNLVRLTTAPVPVPAALWLLGTGLIGLVCFARRPRPDRSAALRPVLLEYPHDAAAGLSVAERIVPQRRGGGFAQ